MVTYRMMDKSCLVVTCLHSGPVPLAQCEAPESVPAYIETTTDIPQGSVARILVELSERYGACGVVAVDDGMVVGKIRCWPKVVCDLMSEACVQQEKPCRALLAVDIASLPARDEALTLRIDCIQVAQAYRGRGIAGEMLTALIQWARDAKWQTLEASALQQIPPLLDWSGMQGRESLQRRGFVIAQQDVSTAVREGVVSQRAGDHGPDVQKQWEAYAGLSDDEAAAFYEMRLDLSSHPEAAK